MTDPIANGHRWPCTRFYNNAPASTPCTCSDPDPLPPTETEGPRAGGVAATASPAHPLCFHGHNPDRCHWCKSAPTADTPFGVLEYDELISTIWSDLDEDPGRFADLLTVALGFIAGLALAFDTDPHDAARAAAVLRSMEQRALWGPDHEQEDHR